MLVRAVGDLDVTRAVHHAGRAALVDEEAHVGPVWLAEEGRSVTGDDLGRIGEADRQRVIRRHPPGPELAAHDLDGRRMLAQERNGRVGVVDRPPQIAPGVGRRLSEPDAVAPLGDDPVQDGRGPLAARHDADDRRVRQPERRHERVGLGGVARRLVGLERTEHGEQVVERRDALAALAGVGRPARDGEAERDRAGVGDHDVEVRRLRDDREIARRAGPDRGQRALAAVLLAGHERDEELAAEPGRGPGRDERPDRPEDRRDAALHVAGAASVQPPVADLAAPRIGGPGGGVAGRHDVDVAGQDDPPAAGAAHPADDDRQHGALGLLAGPGRIGPDRGEVRERRLDRHPGRPEPLGQVGRDGLLAAGDARDPDDRPELVAEGVRVDGAGRRGRSRLHAVDTQLQFGLGDNLVNMHVGSAGDMRNLFRNAASDQIICVRVPADNLEIDRRGEPEIHNLASDIGGLKRRTTCQDNRAPAACVIGLHSC